MSFNTIRIKRRSPGGGTGAPNTMANGELAFNEQTNVLYYGKGTGGANGTATSADPIGGSGAFVDLTSEQNVAGVKYFGNTVHTMNGLKVGSSPVFPASAGQLIADNIVVNTGNLSFLNNATITVPTPTQSGHAATKAYVDGLITTGVVWLEAAQLTTTANITLSGLGQLIDGEYALEGTRVLVKNQTTASQNGVYRASAGAWSRASDFDEVSSTEVSAGKSIFVNKGETNGGTSWVLSVSGTITLGTTPLTWTQIAGGSNETGKNVGDAGLNLFVGKVGTELELRKIVGNIDTGISIDAPGDLNGSARISISTVPLANGGLGTNASTSSGFPLITGGTCTFAESIPASRGGTNNNLSTAADYEIAVTETSNSQKRIATTSFGSNVGLLKRTALSGGAFGYEVDSASYVTTSGVIDGGNY